MLHLVCDLTIAAENAIFGQTGPKVLNLSISFFLPLCYSNAYSFNYFDNPYSWLFITVHTLCRLEALMLGMEVPSCPVW